jgi:competence protein ComEC
LAGVLWAPALPVAVGLVVLGVVGLAGRRVGWVACGAALVLVGAGALAAALERPPRETVLAAIAQARARGPASSTALERVACAPELRDVVVEGVVVEAPAVTPEGSRLVVETLGVAVGVGCPLAPARARIQWRIPGPPCAAPGDRVRLWGRVTRPEPARFEGDVSLRAAWARRGLALAGRVSDPARCVVLERRAAGGPAVLMERARDAVRRAIGRALPADRAAIVLAFATGEQGGIGPADVEVFRIAGLSHLMAVSGLNVAIIAGLALVGLRWLLGRSAWIGLGFGAERASVVLAVPLVVAYAGFVGGQLSALRAVLMMLVVLLAVALRRQADALTSVAWAVIVLVAWRPSWAGDPGLQLSVGALLGLLVLDPWLAGRIEARASVDTWPWLLRAGLAVGRASASATLATLPIVAWHFGRVSLVGVLANVPAAPLGSLVLVPLSLLGGVLEAVWAGAGVWLLQAAGWGAAALVVLARVAAQAPLAAVEVRPAQVAAGLGGVLLLLLLLRRARTARRARLARAGAWLCGLAVGALPWLPSPPSSTLRATFLPVGQGDAAVLELPSGAVVVVDVGPVGAGRRVVVPYLRARGVSRVDLLVLTHPHADHVGGLGELATALPIGRVWWTGDRREAPAALLEPLASLPTEVVRAGQRWRSGAVELEVLGPVRSATLARDLNDGSVVLRVGYGARALLLTGDAELPAEAQLLAAGRPLVADVLKLGHHGSRSSTGEAFLRAVSPSHAVASLGLDNGFGFPHAEVEQRLGARQLPLWRTDHHGAVTVTTDGEALEISGYLGAPSGAERDGSARRSGGREQGHGAIDQRPPIDLPVGRAGQRGLEHDPLGDHRAEEAPRQGLEHHTLGHHRPVLGRVVEDEPVGDVLIGHGDGGDVRHARHRRGDGLQLAELDAEAAHLHDRVGAPVEQQRAGRVVAHAIAGAIHDVAARAVQRVLHESARRPHRVVEVARSHGVAAHVQLALHARSRDLVALEVQHEHLVVRERAADREQLIVGGQLVHDVVGRRVGLGLAVHVEQACVWGGGPQGPQVLGGVGLTGEHDQAQLAEVARGQLPVLGELDEGRGHRVPHRDAHVLDERGDLGREWQVALGDEHHRGPGQERAVQVDDRQIEVERRVGGQHVARGQLEHPRGRLHEGQRLGVGDGHALGAAGRPAGVQHVRQIRVDGPARVERPGGVRRGGPRGSDRRPRGGRVEAGRAQALHGGRRAVDHHQRVERGTLARQRADHEAQRPAHDHQDACPAVLHDKARPLQRRRRIDRQVGRAGPHDAHHGGHGPHALGGPQRDPVARAYAQLHQALRHVLGRAIQRGVVERGVHRAHRGGARCALRSHRDESIEGVRHHGSEAQPARDDVPLDVGGARVQYAAHRVAQHTLHVVLGGVAVATEHAHGVERGGHVGLGDVELGDG